jgi:hypothetical protein
VIQPLDEEEAVGEAGFLVGDGTENFPVDLVELGVSPVVNAAEVLALGSVFGVWQGGAADVPYLGWERPGNGPLV